MSDDKVVEELFNVFAHSLMYKSNIGDYPLTVHPCKYWWVRYGVACTYFSNLYDKLEKAALESKSIPTGYSYRKFIPEELKDLAKNGLGRETCTEYEISLFENLRQFGMLLTAGLRLLH